MNLKCSHPQCPNLSEQLTYGESYTVPTDGVTQKHTWIYPVEYTGLCLYHRTKKDPLKVGGDLSNGIYQDSKY